MTVKDLLRRTLDLLGGDEILGEQVSNLVEGHLLITRGLPAAALLELISGLRDPEIRGALLDFFGITLRTARSRAKLGRCLNAGQGSRAWKLAAIVTRAEAVFGTQEAAFRWLVAPCVGLAHHSPLKLLATSAGTDAVETYLLQLDFGVYV